MPRPQALAQIFRCPGIGILELSSLNGIAGNILACHQANRGPPAAPLCCPLPLAARSTARLRAACRRHHLPGCDTGAAVCALRLVTRASRLRPPGCAASTVNWGSPEQAEAFGQAAFPTRGPPDAYLSVSNCSIAVQVYTKLQNVCGPPRLESYTARPPRCPPLARRATSLLLLLPTQHIRSFHQWLCAQPVPLCSMSHQPLRIGASRSSHCASQQRTARASQHGRRRHRWGGVWWAHAPSRRAAAQHAVRRALAPRTACRAPEKGWPAPAGAGTCLGAEMGGVAPMPH